MASQLPLYGCIQFPTALINYPVENTAVIISIGNRDLNMRTEKGVKIYETEFRVTRMRCWRVTALHNTNESRYHPSNLQLSFEYLMSKRLFRWITITSVHAMLMSVCLQSIVDELLRDSLSPTIAKNQDTTTYEEQENEGEILNQEDKVRLPFLCCQDESFLTIKSHHSQTLPTSSSSPSFYTHQNCSVSPTNCNSCSSTSSSLTAPMEFLTQRLSFKQNPKAFNFVYSHSRVLFRYGDESVQNEAFEGIGDEGV